MKDSSTIRIDLNDLSCALDIIAKHIKKNHSGRTFEVSEEYYWEIDRKQLYDATKDPTDLTLGQLSHDWDRIEQIIKGEAPPIGYALVWLPRSYELLGKVTSRSPTFGLGLAICQPDWEAEELTPSNELFGLS